MDEIVQEFLVESHENLDQLDRDLVELEQRPGERELLASIFRTIHTIKGTSGFLAFGRLEAVTHVGENLLARLRDGRMTMTLPAADVLLRMVDVVRELLAAIEVDGTEGDVHVDDVVAAISAVLDAADAVDSGEPEAVVARVAEPTPVVPVVEAAAPVALPEVDEDEDGESDAFEDEVSRSEKDGEPSFAVQAGAPQPPVAAPVAVRAPATQPDQVAPATREEAPARRSLADSSIRVDVDVLDTLMRLVGELVLTRNQILRQTTDHAGQVDPELVRSSQRLNLIATELQEGVMKTRMQPIDHLWSKLPRVVRDLGAACGKQVELSMSGRETELDRTLLECVKDPLTHLVRNAVDHGLESPAVRLAAGKPAAGTLTLRAYHQSGQVVVEVSDDGAGIDPRKVADKALEKGLRTATQLAAMAGPELLQLIFLPGFSTAAAVTNVSGRGVGMDVVKTNIESIGGTIEVESELGTGTTCRLRIPLTLAIVPALTVECAGDTYAVPQVSLLELVALDADRAATAMEDVNGAPVYRLRGSLLPLVHLTEALGVESERSDGHVLIAVLHAEGKRFGLVIDRVLSTEEIVVKPLGTRIKALGTYTGATILGDGRIALILDVQTLARRALSTEALERIEQTTEETTVVAEPNRMVVAGIGEGRRVGIPLSQVTRLEHIPADTVERVGNREVVQYRGAILPLLRLNRHLGGLPEADGESLVVVVYTERDRSVAIVVEHIVDIVEGDAEINSDIDDFGLLGSAVIRDRVVEVLDVRSAILAADPRFFSSADDEYLQEIR